MAGVNITDLTDLMATTLDKQSENAYRNELIGHNYHLERFLKGAKLDDMTGKKVVFNSMLMGDADDTDDAADGVGVYSPYEVLGSEAKEYQVQGEIPWAYYATHWTLSEQEVRLNRGRERFIQLGKSKIEGCMTRLANVLETHLWSRSGYLHESADKPWLLGIPHWITHDGYAINDLGGSNGTSVANIDPTSSTYNDSASVNRWRNQYESLASPNLLPDGLENMFRKCRFEAPPHVTMSQKPQYRKYRIIMDETTYTAYQALTKRLRDNVGRDVSTGQPIFNNIPMEFTDQIPAYGDSTYETYFLNMDTWKSYIESGNHFRRSKVMIPTNQDARIQRIFFWAALFCDSRRMNGILVGYGATLDEA